MPCSQVVQLARVGVRVLVVHVVCVMLILIAHVVVHAVSYSFRSQFSVVGDVLFTVLSTPLRYHVKCDMSHPCCALLLWQSV